MPLVQINCIPAYTRIHLLVRCAGNDVSISVELHELYVAIHMSDCNDLIAFRRQVCRFAEKLSDEQHRSIVQYITLFPLREK